MASSASIAIRRTARNPVGRVAIQSVVPVALFLCWLLFSAGSKSLYFPPLSQILDALRQSWLSSMFVSDALPTLGRLGLGLLLATVLGVGVGVLLGLAPTLADVVRPVTDFCRAMPAIALLPAFILIFGIGTTMPVALIAYGTVWPILLNTIDGVRSIEPMVQDVAASYRIRLRDRLFRIVLPAASPQIVAGLRVALAIGITVIVFSEMIGSTDGIGFRILQAQRDYEVPQMWAGILFLGIVGTALNFLFWGFETIALRWHRGMRAANR